MNSTTIRMAVAAFAVVAILVPAAASAGEAKVEYSGVPKGWYIGKVNDQADAETCSPPRKLVLTNNCVEIPNPRNPLRPGKRCDWDCVTPQRR